MFSWLHPEAISGASMRQDIGRPSQVHVAGLFRSAIVVASFGNATTDIKYAHL